MPIFSFNFPTLFFLFFAFFFSSFPSLLAQQPAYFILGENQFRGMQIYKVMQDKNLNYWFATNEGIFYYDYHTYQKIECDKTKSNSVFNFVMNEQGIIYCHNLNNQIFEIKGKECKLFYELNSEEVSSDMSLIIADDGNLIVAAKKIIILNKNGTKLFRYDFNKNYLGAAHKIKNNTVLFHISNTDSVITFSKDRFHTRKLQYLSGQSKNINLLKFFSLKILIMP